MRIWRSTEENLHKMPSRRLVECAEREREPARGINAQISDDFLYFSTNYSSQLPFYLFIKG